MTRTITITLTEAQYQALAGAMVTANGEDEGREWTPYHVGQARARENAWTKIVRAWHAPAV